MSVQFYVRTMLWLVLAGFSVASHASGILDLTIGMYRVQAEVAHTEPLRQRGLMHRKEMLAHQGMLFVFPERATHCMWMRNTFLPLAVAFIGEDGKIINVEEMEPQTETNHCAAKPARYALEMNRGWFKQRGFIAGTPIQGIERAPAPQ